MAAVTEEGVVYHVVELTTARESRSEAAGDAPRQALFESWYTSDGRLHRKAFTARDGQKGRLAEDFDGRSLPGRAAGKALRWDIGSNTIAESGFARGDDDVPYLESSRDPGAQLRAFEEQGRLRVAGTTSVDGARSQRLSMEGGGMTVDLLTRYRIYERLALDDDSARLLALDPHPDAKCSEFAHELTEDRDLGFPNTCTAGGRE